MTYFALIEHRHSHTLLITQIMPIEPCSIATSFQTPILVLAWINTHTRSAALRDWDIVLSDSPSHGCIPAKHQNNTFVSYKIHFYLLFTTTYIGARKSHRRTDATTHRRNGWVTVSLYHRVDHYSHTRTIDTPPNTTSHRHRHQLGQHLAFTRSHTPHSTHISHTPHAQRTLPTHKRCMHNSHLSHHKSPTRPRTHSTHTSLLRSPLPSPQKRPFLATLTLMPTFHHACFCHDRV